MCTFGVILSKKNDCLTRRQLHAGSEEDILDTLRFGVKIWQIHGKIKRFIQFRILVGSLL